MVTTNVLAQVPSLPVFNPVDFVAEILVTVAVVVALIFLWQYSPACFVLIRNWGHVLCLRYPDSTKDVWAKCNDRDDGYPSPPWLIHPPTTLIFQPVFETTVCQVPCQGYDCSNWWWQVPWKFLGLHLVLLLSMLSGASEVPSFVSFDKHPRFASWWQLNYFLCSPRFVGKLSNLTSFFFKWVETTN